MVSFKLGIIAIILVILLISVFGIVSAIKDEVRQSDKMRAKRKDIMRRKRELSAKHE